MWESVSFVERDHDFLKVLKVGWSRANLMPFLLDIMTVFNNYYRVD